MVNKNLETSSDDHTLDDIKRLLILLVTKGKATQKEIAETLNITPAQVNNILKGRR